jgi:hypothetical protein
MEEVPRLAKGREVQELKELQRQGNGQSAESGGSGSVAELVGRN